MDSGFKKCPCGNTLPKEYAESGKDLCTVCEIPTESEDVWRVISILLDYIGGNVRVRDIEEAKRTAFRYKD